MTTLLTVKEAAEAAGITEKAIRRRIERDTLWSEKIDGRLLIAQADLRRAGLLETMRDTRTNAGAARLVEFLSHRRGEDFSTYELMDQSLLPRQTCAVALITLRAAGMVEKRYDPTRVNRWTRGQGLTTWRWIGPPHRNAKPVGERRARPRRRAWNHRAQP